MKAYPLCRLEKITPLCLYRVIQPTMLLLLLLLCFYLIFFFVNPIRNQYRYRAAILNKHAQKCEFHIILPLGCCKKIVVANLGYCFRHTGTNKQNHKFCLPVYNVCIIYLFPLYKWYFGVHSIQFLYLACRYQIIWLFPINNRKTRMWTASHRHRVWDLITGLFSQGMLIKGWDIF